MTSTGLEPWHLLLPDLEPGTNPAPPITQAERKLLSRLRGHTRQVTRRPGRRGARNNHPLNWSTLSCTCLVIDVQFLHPTKKTAPPGGAGRRGWHTQRDGQRRQPCCWRQRSVPAAAATTRRLARRRTRPRQPAATTPGRPRW